MIEGDTKLFRGLIDRRSIAGHEVLPQSIYEATYSLFSDAGGILGGAATDQDGEDEQQSNDGTNVHFCLRV